MKTTKQQFKHLVAEHGIKDVSEAVDILIKTKEPGYIADSLIPAITASFKISKRTLFTSNEIDNRNVRKFLVFLMKEYLNVSNKDIQVYFCVSRRTVVRYIEAMRRIIFAEERDIESRIYKNFIKKANKVINHIEKKKYVRNN